MHIRLFLFQVGTRMAYFCLTIEFIKKGQLASAIDPISRTIVSTMALIKPMKVAVDFAIQIQIVLTTVSMSAFRCTIVPTVTFFPELSKLLCALFTLKRDCHKIFQ